MNKHFLTAAMILSSLGTSHVAVAGNEKESAARLKEELSGYTGQSAEDLIQQLQEDLDAMPYLALARISCNFKKHRSMPKKVSTLPAMHTPGTTAAVIQSALLTSRPTA